jgi:CotH protein
MRSLGSALLTAAIAIAALPPGAVAAQDGALAAQNGRLDLPVVVIDAPNGIVDDPKRDATMRVYDRDRGEDYSGHIGIELRGYTSQQDDPKKPYAIETRTPSGANRNVSLLEMPRDNDWVLIASYLDKSQVRNYVVYRTARWVGHYASRTRLVEVVLNGSYEGVYLLGEQLKVDDDRVAVDDSDVSGGYLLEMISTRRSQGEQFFTTPVKKQPIVYKDPNREDLSLGRATWIRNYVNGCEITLYSDRFRNRRRGYRRCLDIDAAVDYMLLNELFRNADTLRNSTYMYKGVDTKLVLGPVWDYDHAVGNDGDAEDNLTSGWEYGASPWAERLYADRAFRRRMAERWQELRAEGLRQRILQTLDRGARKLARGPAERNFARWPSRVTPPEAIDYLDSWLRRRIKWIDENIDGFRPS